MIETGDIIIVHHYFRLFDYRTWLSALIRLKTKCDWNHVEIIQVHEGGLYNANYEVIGGLAKGFTGRVYWRWRAERAMEYEIWKPHNYFTAKQKHKMIDYKGKKYDYWSTFLWHGLEWITGKWYGPKGIAAMEKGNCSEIIMDIAGIKGAHKGTTKDIIDSGLYYKTDLRL